MAHGVWLRAQDSRLSVPYARPLVSRDASPGSSIAQSLRVPPGTAESSPARECRFSTGKTPLLLQRVTVAFFVENQQPMIDLLASRLGAKWPHINSGRANAQAKRKELRGDFEGFDSEDTSIVVFGSLARDEFTDGSDIDWTLLIDGSADPQHLELAHRIDGVIRKASSKPPGQEATFGTMAFSHDLIHQIGGEDDTNRNTTRRILLLLESDVVGRPDAHERVIKNILQRYLLEDTSFVTGSAPHHVPRFLLNDFARYWRTMAVDFAYKRRTRFGKGTVIRNLKLRMSRKLIFVSGLLTCFSCPLGLDASHNDASCKEPEGSLQCVACLREFLRRTPLEILASTMYRFDHLDRIARKLFSSYDEFLGILADKKMRNHLEELKPYEIQSDSIFGNARRMSHEFRDGLLELFFDEKSGMYQLTRTYGVF